MSKVQKRLQRLIGCGLRSVKDPSSYLKELEQLGEAVEDERISGQSRFFKALADETRLKILRLLKSREMCVCEIMIALNLTQPTASHHLGLLESVGLVKDRKEGKWVFYTVPDNEFTRKLKELGVL